MATSKKSQSQQGVGKREDTASSTGSPTKAGLSRSRGEGEVAMDRRTGKDRRSGEDRREKSEPVAVERRKIERRAKVPRRRQIDPTTCERDYTEDEIEFMNALDEYKRTSGRMFPTCSEILEVVRGLGYRKCPAQPSGDAPKEPSPKSPTDAGPADARPAIPGPASGPASGVATDVAV